MLRIGDVRQPSVFALLYDLTVPADHFLRKVHALVDFSFINELVAKTYCADFGRPAKEPELLLRLLFLRHLEGHSDEDVIRRAQTDMAYKWFLGLNPEDPLPDPSVLSRFRRHRIGAGNVVRLLDEIVRQAVEKKLITSSRLVADATHVTAQSAKCKPGEVLRKAAYRLLRSLRKKHAPVLRVINTRVPTTQGLSYEEAEKQLLEYLKDLVREIRQQIPEPDCALAEPLSVAEQIIADERFLLLKGIRSAIEPEARVGHKSEESIFFGYKQHTAMLAEDEIVTAISVTTATADDGQQLRGLVDHTRALTAVSEVAADMAYSHKTNYAYLAEAEILPLIPLNPSVHMTQSKADERFTYNKDADHWICPAGHLSCRRSRFTNNKRRPNQPGRAGTNYFFDKNLCAKCPLREGCYSGQKVGRCITVYKTDPAMEAAKAREQTPEFQAEYKSRAAIEHKFGELKNAYGLARARYRGLFGVTIQAVLTAFTTNIVRLVRLAEAKATERLTITACFRRKDLTTCQVVRSFAAPSLAGEEGFLHTTY